MLPRGGNTRNANRKLIGKSIDLGVRDYTSEMLPKTPTTDTNTRSHQSLTAEFKLPEIKKTEMNIRIRGLIFSLHSSSQIQNFINRPKSDPSRHRNSRAHVRRAEKT